MEIELKLNDKNFWAHFYYGLLNKTMGNDEKAEEELLKAVEMVGAEHKERVLEKLNLMHKNDLNNTQYYDKFEKLVKDKV